MNIIGKVGSGQNGTVYLIDIETNVVLKQVKIEVQDPDLTQLYHHRFLNELFAQVSILMI